jgi:trans-aconitate methyltransferase
MGWKRDVATWLHKRNLLPGRFIRIYIYPLMLRGKKNPYQGGRFFESYYKSLSTHDFSDRITLAPDAHPLHSRFHYNATENSMIKYFVRHPIRDAPTVMDIGSGAGHWIDFWRNTFNASFVYGVDISRTCTEALRSKYAHTENVAILEGDVSRSGVSHDRKFDIISAIGVIFHIVEDDLWHKALINLRDMLNDDGVIVVGGHFGWITQNVQFHVTDDFDSLEQAMNSLQGARYAQQIYFSKRLRSLRQWKTAARKTGLYVQQVVKTQRVLGIAAPENNIMLLKKVIP